MTTRSTFVERTVEDYHGRVAPPHPTACSLLSCPHACCTDIAEFYALLRCSRQSFRCTVFRSEHLCVNFCETLLFCRLSYCAETSMLRYGTSAFHTAGQLRISAVTNFFSAVKKFGNVRRFNTALESNAQASQTDLEFSAVAAADDCESDDEVAQCRFSMEFKTEGSAR